MSKMVTILVRAKERTMNLSIIFNNLLRAVPELNVWEGWATASFFLHGWLVF